MNTRGWAVVVAAAVAMTAGTVPVGVTDAAERPPSLVPELPGGRIAYTAVDYTEDARSCGGGAAGIATMGSDGSERKIVVPGSHIGDPAWSPDGDHLVHTRFLDGGYGSSEIVPADGGTPLVIPNASRGRFSPTGDAIAFLHHGGPNYIDGVGIQRLVRTGEGYALDGEPRVLPLPYATAAPAWSPDGRRLAVAQHNGANFSRPGKLVLLSADGSSTTEIGGGLDVEFTRQLLPAWSPDGLAVLFHVRGQDGFGQSWVYDMLTGRRTQLRPSGGGDWTAAWSPSGQMIAVTGHHFHPNITLVSRTGVTLKTIDIPQLDGARGQVFTADETRLLFVSSPKGSFCDNNLYSVTIAGTDLRQLTTDSTVQEESLAVLGDGVVQRVFGLTAPLMAIAVSQRNFDRAPAVVLAREDDYADGLAGAPLAGKVDGPLLLTRTDRLEPETLREIARLGATTAYLLGGDLAISPAVERELRERGLDVRRLAGEDRFATAAVISDQLDGGAAYVVQGLDPDPRRGWPDAMAVGSLAAHQQRMILPVTRDEVPATIRSVLQRRGVQSVTVVGGTAVVSDAVQRTLQEGGRSVDRVAGDTRYATSRLLADRAVSSGMSAAEVTVSPGRTWAESLVAGAGAGHRGTVHLIVDDAAGAAGQPATAWLRGHGTHVARIAAVGTPDALPAPVLVELARTGVGTGARPTSTSSTSTTTTSTSTSTSTTSTSTTTTSTTQKPLLPIG